jgi:hypothetical protein
MATTFRKPRHVRPNSEAACQWCRPRPAAIPVQPGYGHRCIVEGCARLRRPGFTKCTHHLQGMFSERVKKGHVTRRRARMRCFEGTGLSSPVRPMPFAAPLTLGSPSIGVPTLAVS